jgi:hypothetical protein
MALRQLALMTIAALAAGAYANSRRRRPAGSMDRKPVPLERWEGEGGQAADTLAQGGSDAALVRSEDLLAAGEGRQEGSTSTPIAAGQNLP